MISYLRYFIPEVGPFFQLQSLLATSLLSQVFHQSLSYLCSEVSLLVSELQVHRPLTKRHWYAPMYNSIRPDYT